MSNRINAYKIIGDAPSIYAEVDEGLGQFDLTLLVDGEAIEEILNQNSGRVFYVSKPGSYVVSVKYADKTYHSVTNYFYKQEFKEKKSRVLASSNEQDNFKVVEPITDAIKEFSIEAKIKKGKKSTLDKLIKNKPDFFGLNKKNMDTSSFPDNHAIHNYEYYTLQTTLSSTDANKICHEMEKSDDVIYFSIIPNDKYLVKSNTKTNDTLNAGIGNSAITPDFTYLQTYLDEPHGMNVRNAWAIGNIGKSAIIRHVDYGIYKNHEEFQSGNITVVTSRSEAEDCGHGTASTGCISAANNGFGVTGISHASNLYFYDVKNSNSILNDAKPGDIVSFDIQYQIGQNLLPGIAIKAFWDTAKNLTSKGVIVIAAAGNGGLNLNNSKICPNYGDSGVVLVGACDPGTGRRMGFSNYGHYTSLINSWGSSVVTTAYGDLYKSGNDINKMYTQGFSGTSSATPLCAGALGLLQSHAKSMGFMLNTQSMKKLLSKSSYTEGVADGIGVRPNVAQLMRELDKEFLAHQVNINPFTHASNYLNVIASFKIDEYKEENIPFIYQYTDMPSNGIIAHYPQQGPTELEWWNQKISFSPVRIPIEDSNGNCSILYLKACKWNDAGLFAMNTAACPANPTGLNFRIRLIYTPSENTHLKKERYTGIFPVYINALNYKEYKLPVRINIIIE